MQKNRGSEVLISQSQPEASDTEDAKDRVRGTRGGPAPPLRKGETPFSPTSNHTPSRFRGHEAVVRHSGFEDSSIKPLWASQPDWVDDFDHPAGNWPYPCVRIKPILQILRCLKSIVTPGLLRPPKLHTPARAKERNGNRGWQCRNDHLCDLAFHRSFDVPHYNTVSARVRFGDPGD